MSKQGGRRSRPLDGIRVVEVAVWHAGPGAAAMLGDMGAEVIKIESPSGDPERTELGSFTLKTWDVDVDGWNVMFDVSNRNKKSVRLDLGSEAGREVVHRLAATCDVFLTNLRPSTKRKLGLDYDSLAAEHPGLVHVNITGFGSEGAKADHGAFDTLGQAACGMMWVTGGTTPRPLPSVTLDQMTSVMAAQATTAALLARERDGVGQDVHVSLLGTGVWAWQTWIAATAALGRLPDFTYDRRRKSPMLSIFECGDGRWIVGTNPGTKQWGAFCEAVGRPDLTEGGLDLHDFELLERLYVELDPVMRGRTAAEWTDLLAPLGLMFAPVQTFADVLTDPQVAANDYVVDVDHPVLGRTRLPGFPIRFGQHDAATPRSAPRLGEHTEEVLESLGYSRDEINELTSSHGDSRSSAGTKHSTPARQPAPPQDGPLQ